MVVKIHLLEARSVSMALLTALVLLGTCCAGSASSSAGGKRMSPRNREQRVLSLFNIVQFQQAACTTATDSTLTGTCMTQTECQDQSGTADGNCAAGFGVCCLFTALCGATTTVNQNCTYLRNAEFPSTASASTTCSFSFNAICPNLCQIRLDFNNFVTAPPPTSGMGTGICATGTDFLTVTSPTGLSPPVVCGTLTGQHMFFETGSGSTAGTAVFTFGTATATRTFNVKATYYQCGSLNAAPTDCVQYFTGASGSFQTYNFQGGQLLDSQNYQTCFRQELGFCNIQFSESGSTVPDPFALYGDTANTLAATATEATLCPQTFVMIPSTLVPGMFDRICGGIFSPVDADTVPGTVISDFRPFAITTFVNGIGTVAAATAGLGGYNLDFTQVPCAN